MPIERLIPESVYTRLPGGRLVETLYSQVVSATGTKQVHVSGTVSLDSAGEVVGAGDMQTQVQTVLENIEQSLASADATVTDVVRIKIYTVDVGRYIEGGAPELIEFFGDGNLPASTLLGVEELAHPDLLVEIEATAVVE